MNDNNSVNLHANMENLLKTLEQATNAEAVSDLGFKTEAVSLAVEELEKIKQRETAYNLFDEAPVALMLLDHSLRIAKTNELGRDIFRDNYPLLDVDDIDQQLTSKSFQALIAAGIHRFLVWTQQNCQGSLELTLVGSEPQQIVLLNGFVSGEGLDKKYFISITPHKAPSHELSSFKIFQKAFDVLNYPVMLINKKGVVLVANPSLTALLGTQETHLIGKVADQLLLPPHKKMFSELNNWVDDYNNWEGFVSVQADSSIALKAHLSISALKPSDVDIEYFVVSIDDITDVISEKERLQSLANTDGLTRISNRLHFTQVFEEKLAQAQRDGRHLTLFYIDLDKFKELNDNHGHQFGDMLLTQIANRISHSTRKNDFVARIGGDEFAILMLEDLPKDSLEKFAQHMLSQLSEPYHLDEIQYKLSLSIGAARYPFDGVTKEEILHNADVAMYAAKGSGQSHCQFYDKQLHVNVAKQCGLEEDLNNALNSKGFELYFQPQHDLTSGDIIGFEALFRLKHEATNNSNIEQLIAEAERTGLIVPLGKKILRLAFHHIRAWLERGSKFPVAINLSPLQLRDESTLAYIKKLITDFPECAPLVHLEITETSLFERSDYIEKVVNELSDLGMTIVLDDFGTGYSSIYSLKKFPFKIIKIDGVFVNAVEHGDDDDRLILIAMIKMIQGLGLEMVVECVENQVQVDFLLQQGCTVGQGYFYAKAMPAFEVIQYINQHSFRPKLVVVK